jgi:Tfp pilus assembly protein PilX
MNPVARARAGMPARQEGIVLIIALIVLVAMTLAGIGMVRSIDTGTLVAGNIGFRESAVATADTGIEAARTWLMNNRNLLTTDIPSSGYYSSRQDGIDFTGNLSANGAPQVDWGGTNPSAPVKAFSAGSLDATGAPVYYVINRLCSIPGSINAAGQSCAYSQTSGIGSTQQAADYSSYGLTVKNLVYYRITARVNGPKNTVSYVQAVILI